jgi:hypothetical protein
VAGEHFPPFSRDWEAWLRDRLDRSGLGSVRFHLIRAEGRRAIVEVDHRQALPARSAWTTPDPSGFAVAPRRTWGTLVGAKAWLREPHR